MREKTSQSSRRKTQSSQKFYGKYFKIQIKSLRSLRKTFATLREKIYLTTALILSQRAASKPDNAKLGFSGSEASPILMTTISRHSDSRNATPLKEGNQTKNIILSFTTAFVILKESLHMVALNLD